MDKASTKNCNHPDTYAALIEPILAAGAKSYAFVGVDEEGEVFWAAYYEHQPKVILRYLDQIRSDIKQYIKQQQANLEELEAAAAIKFAPQASDMKIEEGGS